MEGRQIRRNMVAAATVAWAMRKDTQNHLIVQASRLSRISSTNRKTKNGIPPFARPFVGELQTQEVVNDRWRRIQEWCVGGRYRRKSELVTKMCTRSMKHSYLYTARSAMCFCRLA